MGSIRGLPLNALVSWKNANLGFTLLGIFYLIFPWFASQVFETTTALFGLMFLSIGITRAKPRCSVIGGLCIAFIGMAYFFASIAFLDVYFLWITSIILFAIFVIFEFGYVKFGPSTSHAKAFILVPLSLLTFSLILAFIGKNPMIPIDWSNLSAAPWVFINYVAVLMFALFNILNTVGWRIMGPSTNKLIMLFAVVAIVSAFVGIYQGTLFQWT